MIATLLPLMLAGVAQVLSAPGVEEFPGARFDGAAREALEQRVLTVWPGPAGLLSLWQTGVLDEEEQVALLLGGGSFHDPQLLPAYLEGIASPAPRVRSAALVGYRELLADEAPTLEGGVSPEAAGATLEEMQEVVATLRRSTLVELWMAALLATEGISVPGWSGVVLHRQPRVCYEALDRLLWPEDLDQVLAVYDLAEDPMLLGPLVPFVEGMALERFPVRPWQAGRRWSRQIFDEADRAVRAWRDARCREARAWPAEDRLAALIANSGHPVGAGACEAWLEVLARGRASWWPMAVRQLYRCGAPPQFVPMSRGEGPETREVRTRLLGWYGIAEPTRRR
jgi:hypothetical protein